ncbi:hypothetical protein TRSC58_01105 [Trypanosoma rangeli SC58]|uniref:Dynein regulatory complex protein 12 n=1 Tax=Trypanosoma rangeli SC58 TaxID=429131 RepID=A0A061J8D3_TRYRA|nr:hypothetical protein TRSC58_01105 [Trypanosoma rangeli SC58]
MCVEPFFFLHSSSWYRSCCMLLKNPLFRDLAEKKRSVYLYFFAIVPGIVYYFFCFLCSYPRSLFFIFIFVLCIHEGEMPPKGKQKNLKSDKDLQEDEQLLNDDVMKMSMRLSALKTQYAGRLEEILALRREQKELQCSCVNFEDDLRLATSNRVDVLTDFARQYKTKEDEKIRVCTKLDDTLNRLEEEKLKLTDEAKRAETEYEDAINALKAEYDSLLARIDEMESDFGVLLDDTRSRVSDGWTEPISFPCIS